MCMCVGGGGTKIKLIHVYVCVGGGVGGRGGMREQGINTCVCVRGNY